MSVEPEKKRRLPFLRPKTKAGKAGLIAAGVVGGLLALDAIALVVAIAVGSSAIAR